MSPQYSHQQWKSYTWRKAERIYFAALQQNLFGEWVLVRRWGVTDSRRGRTIEQTLDNYKQGLQCLEQVTKRREARGYSLK